MNYIKPNLLLSLALLALLTTFSSCEVDLGLWESFENCPEDIDLGEISFVSNDIWPLRGQEDFTFVNQKGDELVFMGSSGNHIEHSHLTMETICTSAFNLSEQYSYYEPEYLSFVYHLGDGYHYLVFLYQINNDRLYPKSSSDTALYESLYVEYYDTARITDPGWNKHFFLITSDRGNSISQETMSANDEVRIIDDTTFYGTQYKNLICPKTNPGVFYSNEFGIVLLRYNSDWWHLKH